MPEPIVTVRGLRKTYPGGVRAVDGLSFEVQPGEIFGLLGPNGAGKTTTLGLLEGLLQPDGGQVRVLGLDLPAQAAAVRRRIGVQLQRTSLIPDLTVREQLEVFARLYEMPNPRRLAADLLARLNLTHKAEALPDALSGGQQQRLALALALVNEPQLVFLDEPTAGLDPQARRSLWRLIRELQAQGRTVILTTHYMEEAERLCDRVAIMDHGRLLALGAPSQLTAQLPPVAGPRPSLEDLFLHLTGEEVRA